MRKWMFVCAVVTVAGFFAEPVLAQETIQAPTQTQPVVTSSAPRGGLFSRMRDRRRGTMVVVEQPMTAKTMPATPTTQVQPTTPANTQMATTDTQVVQPRRGLLARLRNR